jgi:GNAT superfamily N-acetyltransferase
MLRYLTEVDGKDHVAVVAILPSPDLKTERGVGIARFVRATDDPEVAEAAVTVVDDMQRKGLGRVLLATLAECARVRGIKRVRAEVLASNDPIRHLLEEVKPTIVGQSDGVLTVEVPLDPETHASALARLFRAAASHMAVLVRHLRPPHDADA